MLQFAAPPFASRRALGGEFDLLRAAVVSARRCLSFVVTATAGVAAVPATVTVAAGAAAVVLGALVEAMLLFLQLVLLGQH
jgi:hypothetical protein